jgi:hypothetical protein
MGANINFPFDNWDCTSWILAGGGPAASYFLCVAKESNQRKATAKPLPFGFPWG